MQQYVAASKIIGYDAQNTRDLKSIVFLILSTEVFWWFHGIFSIQIVTIFYTFLNDSRLHVSAVATFVVKKKSISPLWELNAIFM